MGKTKLTRKEILSEDPIQEAIINLVEFFRIHRKKIILGVSAALLLGVGIYIGFQYLDNREIEAQEQLAKAMDIYHAQVADDAPDDPYSGDSKPLFRSDEAKYQAAREEFSSIVTGYGYSKVTRIARYYLGLTQLRLGQTEEGIQSLEWVVNNSRDPITSNLAKRVLAAHYFDQGNNARAQELLEGMIKDLQCELPKDDLSVQLSRVLVAQDKHKEAIEVLREAENRASEESLLKSKVAAEIDKLEKDPAAILESPKSESDLP